MLARRMSLDGFEFFENDTVVTDESVLSKHIEWEFYSGGGGAGGFFLDASDVELLQDYDKASAGDQQALLEESGPKYAAMFAKAIQNITTEDPVQYLLTMIDQLLTVDERRVKYFHDLVRTDYNPFASFLRVLARSNYHPFTIEKACRVVAVLLSTLPAISENKSVHQFCSWTIAKLTDQVDKCRGAALEALKLLLLRPESHIIFVRDGGIAALTRLLRFEAIRNTQLVYQTGFCLWILSFNASLFDEFLKARVVETIVEVLRSVSREKVVRICIAVLRNLCGKSSFNEVMVHQKFLATLELIKERSFADNDIIEDIKFVEENLQKDAHVFSSFDVLVQELKSEKLSWTPVHTEAFWKENSMKCENDGFAAIKSLIRLLDSSDKETVAIACFDIGEFARLYPGGKKVVQNLGGKEKLMKQMSHDNKDVQQQALLCVQKLMVTNWSHLQRGAA